MKIYNSLDKISVYLFFKLIETNDYSLLIKNKKQRKKVSLKDRDILNEAFKELVHEYCVATNNFKIIGDIKKKIYISKLEYKYFLLSKILAIFEKHEEIEVLFVLDGLGYNFKDSDNIDLEMKKLINNFKHLKNKINITKLKYNKESEKSDNKNFDLDSIALSLERALDLKYNIDVKTTSMRRWINLNNLANKISNEQSRISRS